LRWECDTAKERGRSRVDHCFQRPVLFSAMSQKGFPMDIIDLVFQFCHSQCEASYMWQKPKYTYESRRMARQFATKTLRKINLYARGDGEIANNEAWQDQLAR
jgi:hypothetical protein